MNLNWIPWLIGWAVPFLIKYANYMLQESGVIVAKIPLTNLVVKGRQWGLPVATLRFLFGDTKTATTTFIAFTLQLVIGAWYIDDLPLPYIGKVVIEKHWVLALFMSSMLELIGPFIIRGIVSEAVDRINRFRGIQVVPKPTEE